MLDVRVVACGGMGWRREARGVISVEAVIMLKLSGCIEPAGRTPAAWCWDILLESIHGRESVHRER